MTKRFILLAIVLIALLGLLAYSKWRPDPPRVSGFIEADEIRLGSRVGGRVSAVNVQLLGLNLSIEMAMAKGDALQLAPARNTSGHGTSQIRLRRFAQSNQLLGSREARVLQNPDVVGHCPQRRKVDFRNRVQRRRRTSMIGTLSPGRDGRLPNRLAYVNSTGWNRL